MFFIQYFVFFWGGFYGTKYYLTSSYNPIYSLLEHVPENEISNNKSLMPWIRDLSLVSLKKDDTWLIIAGKKVLHLLLWKMHKNTIFNLYMNLIQNMFYSKTVRKSKP